jgi:hypothetical protein
MQCKKKQVFVHAFSPDDVLCVKMTIRKKMTQNLMPKTKTAKNVSVHTHGAAFSQNSVASYFFFY